MNLSKFTVLQRSGVIQVGAGEAGVLAVEHSLTWPLIGPKLGCWPLIGHYAVTVGRRGTEADLKVGLTEGPQRLGLKLRLLRWVVEVNEAHVCGSWLQRHVAADIRARLHCAGDQGAGGAVESSDQ